MKVLLLLATSTTLPFVLAFNIPVPHATTVRNGSASNLPHPNANVAMLNRGFGVRRQMSSDGNDGTSSSPRKRRTRKDGKLFSPTVPADTDSENDNNLVETASQTKAEETPPAPAPPKENTVVMQVRDIRDVVSGAPEALVVEPQAKAVVEQDADELADDEEWEYYDVDAFGNEIVLDEQPGGKVQDESIEQLLADARSMRSQTPKVEEEKSVMDTVFEVIANIVTVDFFVVLVLLAWFLAGIFCSYILKDDTVQIAFNMNFERLTQPALGLLMVGSIAGSFGNKDEEEE